MQRKKINLEEILKLHCNVADYDKDAILKAMKEAIKQSLELAVENAKCLDVNRNINKQSILDTINQIE